ncbi:unnamed protein product [Darwinula stevensoni]|uniref:Striatin N-terminal domain-containing protein n=1 Tax=Darwinula stevensoni TaxID=69355 RepID=A0A7R8X9L6_9CRUS|nr:unnamed protein product [Darwinula stevensoni]CAG0890757.1 unnamed protein product [Darwinula stevensoni]
MKGNINEFVRDIAQMDEAPQNQNGQIGPPLSGNVKCEFKNDEGQQSVGVQYSIPGILHFIQHEWARFEMEKAQWEVERAELQARIAFLQGERKGQENLKNDLIRRIKMLEFALKQERAKFHKLKYGVELGGDMKVPLDEPPAELSSDGEMLLPTVSSPSFSWRQGRQLLRQYLQEIGYTDTIIDVRSSRVRSLLGLNPVKSENDEGGNAAVNGTDNNSGTNKRVASDSQQKRGGKKPSTGSTLAEGMLLDAEEAVMANFAFLATEGVMEDDDENLSDEEREDLDETQEIRRPRAKGGVSSEVDEMDAETEEVLSEFDFLTANEGNEDEWGVPHALLNKLKDEYRKDRQKNRKGPFAQQRPSRSDLQAMLVNLSESGDGMRDGGSLEDEEDDDDRGGFDVSSSEGGSRSIVGLGASSAARRNLMGPVDEALDSELGLGELAQLTVNNEAESTYDQIANSKEAFRKTWTGKYTLRSHFDGVRALGFLPVEQALITASEDHTLKLWNLQKTVPTKKSASLDVEPVYTFRGHHGPVLCLCVNPSGEMCFSGGLDASIRCWKIPNTSIDPYDSFDPDVLATTLTGHGDAVWALAVHPNRPHLLSCSADGSVRLWQPTAKQPLLSSISSEQDGIPTSVDFLRTEVAPNHMVVGFRSGTCAVYDLECGKPVVHMDTSQQESGKEPSTINSVVCHPTLPLCITGHEDRHIRFWDTSNGGLLYEMAAHLDAVTSLALDPNGLYLVSGSHDCSIRLWNLDDKTCVQEMHSHRKKFDESIFAVAFHPSKPFIASAGADGLAKVYV